MPENSNAVKQASAYQADCLESVSKSDCAPDTGNAPDPAFATASSDKIVRHFRQILLWPLQLMPVKNVQGRQMGRHWEIMQKQVQAANSPWQARATEFDGPASDYQERYYREFVTFLPYVQRFLYGEGCPERHSDQHTGDEAQNSSDCINSPLHVFRRSDIETVRMHYKSGDVLDFSVAHIDLYFFFDIDVIILAFEIKADNLTLHQAQDTMFRFGRAFPSQWDEDGEASSCLHQVDWINATGEILCSSDYSERSEYLQHVGRHRAPRMAKHWEYLLYPLVLHHSEQAGQLRYRQIEYHRMPLMAYLSFDNPFLLTDEEFFRLGSVARPESGEGSPYSARIFKEFLEQCCYDRFWAPENKRDNASTRMLCNGYAFILLGKHGSKFFSDPLTGALGQFRHQHFILTLIAHFHKAALLLLSDRLASSLAQLDVRNVQSVREFKRDIRALMEVFLRFNQRYWFREMSNQVFSSQLFTMLRSHLGTEELFKEVKESVQNMNQFLENDDLRRQAETVVRLTVVTILGLVGTTVTGFLGMNLFSNADDSVFMRSIYFLAVLIPAVVLTLYTVVKSRNLSEFLDAIADDRMSWKMKWTIFAKVWKVRKKPQKTLL